MTDHPIPDAALESEIAILGKKGRGKSYTARGLVERLLDKGRRVIVLDPLSTWWGLKAGPKASTDDRHLRATGALTLRRLANGLFEH